MPGDYDKRNQPIWLSEEMLRDMQRQALRLDRSLSWVVQQAWRVARYRMLRMQGNEGRSAEPGATPP